MGQDESLEEVKCPECKSSKMVDDLSLGEIVCKNCGLVISEKEFAPGFSGERRMFSTEEILEASRVGPPIDPSRVDKGLSTEISYSDIAKLKSISPEQRGTLKRMSKDIREVLGEELLSNIFSKSSNVNS